MSEMPNPIPRDVSLAQLIAMCDACQAELVNPVELYEPLVASVGKWRAGLMLAGVLVFQQVRSDAFRQDMTKTSYVAGLGAGLFTLLALTSLLPFADGLPGMLFAGAAGAFGLISLLHNVTRDLHGGEW